MGISRWSTGTTNCCTRRTSCMFWKAGGFQVERQPGPREPHGPTGVIRQEGDARSSPSGVGEEGPGPAGPPAGSSGNYPQASARRQGMLGPDGVAEVIDVEEDVEHVLPKPWGGGTKSEMLAGQGLSRPPNLRGIPASRSGACRRRQSKRTPKLKPRWDVHLWGDADWLGCAGESISSVLGECPGSVV